jgi:hypothetical protein
MLLFTSLVDIKLRTSKEFSSQACSKVGSRPRQAVLVPPRPAAQYLLRLCYALDSIEAEPFYLTVTTWYALPCQVLCTFGCKVLLQFRFPGRC